MTTKPRFAWWIGLVLLALCGALGAVFVAPRKSLPVATRPAEERGVLRVVCFQSLVPDPHRRTFPVSTYNHLTLSLWEPLTECDPATGEPMPAAAEGWRWSDDFRVLTLRIRADARWSNGDAVTAHDFVRSWLRLLRQSVDVAYTLFPVKNAEAYHRSDYSNPSAVGVRALDDLTLRIELDQPRVTLVAELADPLLSPLHATTEKVLASKVYVKNPSALITNGPFRFAGVRGDDYQFVASDHYHGRKEVRLNGVNFIRVDNLTTGALLIASGKADLLSPMGRAPAQGWPTDRSLTVDSELALAVVSLYFNTTRGPMQDTRVRRALALALKRSTIISDADRERLVPAKSWVPDMPGRAGLDLCKEDATEARRLLAEAGYPEGKDFPILRMCLPAWMQGVSHPLICTEQWFQQLGVRTYVTYDSPDTPSEDRLNRGDYDVTYGTLVATVPDASDLLSTFLMPEIYSETKWRDPETIKALAAANKTTGAARLAYLEKAERRAMAEASVVPLLFERRQVLRAAEVEGWYPDPLARQSLRHLSLKPTAIPETAATAYAIK